jgi:hypothetical protein
MTAHIFARNKYKKQRKEVKQSGRRRINRKEEWKRENRCPLLRTYL